MYVAGLGWRKVGSFRDHGGFDGAMVQGASEAVHLEFTCRAANPVIPTPTHEDLLVVYIAEADAWAARCKAMVEAGFAQVEPLNPYWQQHGRTFRDHDGYLVVIQQGPWIPSTADAP